MPQHHDQHKNKQRRQCQLREHSLPILYMRPPPTPNSYNTATTTTTTTLGTYSSTCCAVLYTCLNPRPARVNGDRRPSLGVWPPCVSSPGNRCVPLYCRHPMPNETHCTRKCAGKGGKLSAEGPNTHPWGQRLLSASSQGGRTLRAHSSTILYITVCKHSSNSYILYCTVLYCTSSHAAPGRRPEPQNFEVHYCGATHPHL